MIVGDQVGADDGEIEALGFIEGFIDADGRDDKLGLLEGTTDDDGDSEGVDDDNSDG